MKIASMHLLSLIKKGEIFTWGLVILSASLFWLVNAEAWNVLVSSFTSEVTGDLRKAAVLLPFLLLINFVLGIIILYFNKTNKTTNFFVASIALTALILRLVWIILIPTTPESDFKIYHEMAILFSNNQTSEFIKPFGYPLILSLPYRIYPAPEAGRVLNVILGVTTVLLVYWAGKTLSNPNSGLIAMGWMAISPSEVFMTSVLGTEVAISTFVTGAVAVLLFLIHEAKHWKVYLFIFPGIILGIAVLIRPTTAIILLLLLALIFFKRGIKNKLRISIYLIGGLLFLPAILILWTSIISQEFTVRSLFYDSYPLLSGTNIPYKGIYNLEDVRLYFSIPEESRSQKVLEIAITRMTEVDFAVLAKFMAEKILFLLSDNRYGSMWAFYTVSLPLTHAQLFSLTKYLDVFAQSWYFISLAATSIVVLWFQARKEPIWILFFGILLVTLLPHTVFEVQTRYHHVLLPFFALACGIFTAKFLQKAVPSPRSPQIHAFTGKDL